MGARHYASRGMSALAGGRRAQIHMSATTAHARAVRYAVEIVKDLPQSLHLQARIDLAPHLLGRGL